MAGRFDHAIGVRIHRRGPAAGPATPWPMECMDGPGWPRVPWWHNSGMAGRAAAGRVGSAAAVPGLIWAVEVV